MKKLLILFVTILLLTACKEKVKEKVEETEKMIKTEVVNLMEINKKVTVGSEIEPFKEVVQTSGIDGEIKEVFTINGRWAEEGEKVIQLKNDQIEANYLQAKAGYIGAKSSYERTEKFAKDQLKNQLIQTETAYTKAKMDLEKAEKGAKDEELEIARAGVKTAKKNYEVSKSTYEKNKTLYEKKFISEDTFLSIENQYRSADSSYTTAQKNLELLELGADKEDISILKSIVKSAQDSYDLIKKMYDQQYWEYDIAGAKATYLNSKAMYELTEKVYKDLSVKAEISGIITDLDLKEKNKIGKDQLMFTVINNDDMILKVGVDERDINGIQKYNTALIEVEALNEKYEGTVYEINPAADKQTKKFLIKVKVPNKNHKMKKGMYAKVTILAGAHEALMVPKESIVVNGTDTYVFKIENGLAKKIKIETGYEEGNYQEIITDKIGEGDKLAVEGQFLLNDGDKVREVNN